MYRIIIYTLILLFFQQFSVIYSVEYTLKDPGKHPYLFFDSKEFEEYRNLIKNSKSAALDYNKMVSLFKGRLDKPIQMPTQEVKGYAYAPASPSLRQHMELCDDAVRMGFAYNIENKKEYALKVKEILLGYADKYVPFYCKMKQNKKLGIFEQILEEACFGIGMAFAYDMIADSGILTETEKKNIENNFLKEIAKKIDGWSWETNWNAYFMAAYGTIAFVTKDMGAIKNTLYGNQGMAPFHKFLDDGITEGGIWIEGTIGYHWAATRALIYFIEASLHWGIDFYSYGDNKFKRLFDAPIHWAYPNNIIPAMNDSGEGNLFDSSTQWLYSYAYLHYKDPLYLPIIKSADSTMLTQTNMFWQGYLPTRLYDIKIEGKLPPPKSVFLSGTDLAILKDGEGENVRYLLLDCGTNGHGHSHRDCLEIIFFANGTPFLIDSPSLSYSDKRHEIFCVQTIAHNTVNVNERGQKKDLKAKADLVIFDIAPKVKVAKGKATPEVYGGDVEANRTVFMLPDYIADFFWIDAKESSDLDYVLHFEKEFELEGVNLSPMKIETAQRSYKTITDTKSGRADKSFSVLTKADSDRQLTLNFLGQPGTVIFTGRGPVKPMLIVRRNKPATVFSMVGETHALEKKILEITPVKVLQFNREVPMKEAYGINVKTKIPENRSDIIMLNYKGSKFSFDKIIMNGEVGVVSNKKGNLDFIYLGNGTYIEIDSRIVEASIPSNLYIEQVGQEEYTIYSTGKDESSIIMKGFFTKKPIVKQVDKQSVDVAVTFNNNILTFKVKQGSQYKIN